MSLPGRPKGEYRSAQREGTPKSAAVLTTLQALAQQAHAAGDAAAANEVLARIAPIANDTSLAPSRELGIVLLDVAGTLTPLGDPGAVQALFHNAHRVLNDSGEIRADDQLLLWNNLAALYDRYGITASRDQAMALIDQLAASYSGPLERRGAQVFLDQALRHQGHGRTEPMLVLLRQVHRYRNSAAAVPAERLSWLEIYAAMLARAGRDDEAESMLAQGAELARELGDAACEANLLNTRASVALSRDDLAVALSALERAQQVVEGTPALADSALAAGVLHNLVGARLRAADASHYAEALSLSERTIELLRHLGRSDGDDFAYALYQRAVLTETLGDWTGAARGYAAAAAVSGVRADAATYWLSLAGRAWFEAGEFDAASGSYLAAVRRRVAVSAAA